MSDEIILNDNDGSSNILEYIEITNSGTGTLDATKDMVILEDYNPNVPVIRPPYIAENIANKKNNLNNPNTTGYTSTLAVYNALLPFNNYTGTTTSQIIYISGITDQKLNTITFTNYTGNTIPDNYYNKIQVDQLISGGTSGKSYDFIASGSTIIKEVTGVTTNIITIYSPSGITGNYAPLDSFTTHTGNTNIHYSQSAITITENQVTNLINDLNNKSNTGHTHNQYLESDTFSTYTGTTIPNNYYNKSQIDSYSGKTNNKINYISGVTASLFDTYDFAASDETTAITIGTAKYTDHWPYNFSATTMFVGLNVASSSGNPTFDFNDKNGNSIFSTRPIILVSGETSLTNPSQPVMITTSFLMGDRFSVDFDIAGTGAKGVKFHFIGKKS